MRRWKEAALALAALGLSATLHPSRAAVATGNIQVSGVGPYTINYVLAQTASSLKVEIFTASGTLVRTITETDTSDTGPMGRGSHSATGTLPPISWDGNKQDGTPAPVGSYYAQITTSGASVTAITLLTQPPLAFQPQPGRVEARNVYGGDVNRKLESPRHNLAYFGVGKTNSNNNGSAGVEIVYPDGTSTILPEPGAEGAFDYVTASVLTDDSILLGGQGLLSAGTKQLLNVDPVSGAILGTYGKGSVDVRAMQSFGAGPGARTYWVNDLTTTGVTSSIALLNPISNTTGTPIYQTIITQADVAAAAGSTGDPGARGLVVNRAETALWICGNQGGSLTPTNQFVVRFDKVNGVWQKSGTFAAAFPVVPSGVVRGCTLSPDEQTLWVTNADGNAVANNRIFALDASTGANKGADFELFFNASGGADFTPQGITASANDIAHPATTGYNLFISGYRSFAQAVTSGNSVAVVAPKDNGSTDVTRSEFFDVATGAAAVHVTSGPTVSNITDTSATITWDTDFRSTTVVHYGGAAGSYTSPDVVVPGITSHHVVNLNNLVPGGTYFFQVESAKDPLTSATATGQLTTTPDITILSESLNAAQTTATLSFTTNVAASGVAHWGDNPTTFNQADITIPAGTTHAVAFSNLSPGKTYYFQLALTGTNAIGLTTLTSAFATAVSGGAVGTTTDNAFNLAHKVSLAGLGTSPVSLAAQGLPGLAPFTPQPLLTALYDEGVVAYNGYLYAIGGGDSTGTAVSTVYYIKLNADGSMDATDGWKAAANALPSPRKEISNACFAYNGNLYVVGGVDEAGAVTTTVLYAPLNPTTGDVGAWKGLDTTQSPAVPVNPMPAGRTRGSAVVADGTILVSGGAGGGVNSTNYVAQIRPDGSTGPWQTDTPLAGTRWKQRTLANDHHVYSIGGDNAAGAHISSVFISTLLPDATLLPFYPAENYPTHGDGVTDVGHYAMAAGMMGGKVVTAGGGNLSGISGDDNGRALISYAPVGPDDITGAWAASTDVLPQGVEDLDGAVYNNTFYVVGGRTLGFAGTSTTNPATTGVTDVTILYPTPDPSGPAFAYAGTLESRIIDLGAMTNLSHLKVNSSGGAAVEVRYRFANTDGVFTDWFTAASADADITGGARWFQYELVLKGDGTATPTVSSVALTTAAGGVAPLSRADAIKALQIAGGLVQASPDDKLRLNVNGDNVVNLQDAAKILRTVNGL